MIPLDSATQTAQANPIQVPRDFLEIRARDRSTGNPVHDFIWSGHEDITHSVLDPLTGTEKSNTWFGAGHLVGVGAVTRVSNLTISRVTIRMSEISDRVNDLIRAYDPKYGTVILYRSFLDPDTMNFVSAGRTRFLGQIDNIEFTDPEEGGVGGVQVTCKNNMQDLTRANPATRSDAYQRLRNENDTFRKYVASIGQREFFWGKK